VVDGVALRGRKLKPGGGGPRERGGLVAFRDGMANPAKDLVGVPFEPPLDSQHLTTGKALPAQPIAAEPDDLVAGANLRQCRIELLAPVRVAMEESRQVVVGKGRLLVRDRGQGSLRAGEDALAVAAGDGAMIICAFSRLAMDLAARARRADLVLRWSFSARGSMRASRPNSASRRFA
jgi:hypothetical protein